MKFNRFDVGRESWVYRVTCLLLSTAHGLNVCFSEQGEDSPFPTAEVFNEKELCGTSLSFFRHPASG